MWPGNGNAKKTKTVTGNSTILKAVMVTDDNKLKKTVTQTFYTLCGPSFKSSKGVTKTVTETNPTS